MDNFLVGQETNKIAWRQGSGTKGVQATGVGCI